MKPTARVLLGIGALLVAMALALFITWHFQTRALGDALVADVEAALARTITRDPRPDSPKHENGYACFAAAVGAMPRDVSPFDLRSQPAFSELMDAGVLAEPWPSKVASLEPWAESLRSCGDSTVLKFVPTVTPFMTDADTGSMEAQMALVRMTRLQVRLLGAESKWEAIVERCLGTLEVGLDQSHVNLIGVMLGASAVKTLTPPCAHAVQQLQPEGRAAAAKRFRALRGRMASNREFFENERLAMGLLAHRWELSGAQRARTPASQELLEATLADPVVRFSLARLWTRQDKAMRELITVADLPGPARVEASLAIDAVFNGWWVPPELSGSLPDYEKFFLRNEEAMTLVQLLADVAEGVEKPLPPNVTRIPEGLQVINLEGEQLLIPVGGP